MDPSSINPGHWTRKLLEAQGLSDSIVAALTISVDLIVLVIVSLLADFVARSILMRLIRRFVLRTKATWDDHFLKEKVFEALVHLLPTILIRAFIPLVFEHAENWIAPLQNLLSLLLIYQIAILINRAARATSHVLEDQEQFKDKPIRTLLSVVQFLTWFIAILAVISQASGTPLGSLMAGMAGATAIIILIFQDAINGLLANFQIAMYDLLRKGDWITFERFGVDGDVISLDLTTVKIKNFDNTISSVPAKAFVTESFVNWRGMQMANVRRIKRNLVIDIDSVQFCSEDLLQKLSGIERVRSYIQSRKEEISQHNLSVGADKSQPVNGRHLTNLGVFRMYASQYLMEHAQISDEHSLMVRQLQPLGTGVPLEVYCFAKEINWVPYEGIVSDIFDHLIAAAPAFGLRLYQAPTSRSGYMGTNAGQA
ncbi:MAG: mechanosensitive ion channel [Schleiferiaceae bacterium]|nr:mechanosensitive ion channel [Schleiferiaceae bacterium]